MELVKNDSGLNLHVAHDQQLSSWVKYKSSPNSEFDLFLANSTPTLHICLEIVANKHHLNEIILYVCAKKAEMMNYFN